MMNKLMYCLEYYLEKEITTNIEKIMQFIN